MWQYLIQCSPIRSFGYTQKRIQQGGGRQDRVAQHQRKKSRQMRQRPQVRRNRLAAVRACDHDDPGGGHMTGNFQRHHRSQRNSTEKQTRVRPDTARHSTGIMRKRFPRLWINPLRHLQVHRKISLPIQQMPAYAKSGKENQSRSAGHSNYSYRRCGRGVEPSKNEMRER